MRDPIIAVTHYKTEVWKDHPFLISEVNRQYGTNLPMWMGPWTSLEVCGSLEEVELILMVKYQKKLGKSLAKYHDIDSYMTEDI